MYKYILVCILCPFLFIESTYTQSISDFISVSPTSQINKFVFPEVSHNFQKIIEHGDPIMGGNIADNFDFTCFVPCGSADCCGG